MSFLGFLLEVFDFLLCYGSVRDFLRSRLWLLVLLDDTLLFLGSLLFCFRDFFFRFWYFFFLFFGDNLELLTWLGLLLFLFLELLLTCNLRGVLLIVTLTRTAFLICIKLLDVFIIRTTAENFSVLAALRMVLICCLGVSHLPNLAYGLLKVVED
jgi:hypothetical protein